MFAFPHTAFSCVKRRDFIFASQASGSALLPKSTNPTTRLFSSEDSPRVSSLTGQQLTNRVSRWVKGWGVPPILGCRAGAERWRHMAFCEHLSDGRRGRESNPRIEVLQTPTLPLGYPAL